jgi:hypothetical protein
MAARRGSALTMLCIQKKAEDSPDNEKLRKWALARLSG